MKVKVKDFYTTNILPIYLYKSSHCQRWLRIQQFWHGRHLNWKQRWEEALVLRRRRRGRSNLTVIIILYYIMCIQELQLSRTNYMRESNINLLFTLRRQIVSEKRLFIFVVFMDFPMLLISLQVSWNESSLEAGCVIIIIFSNIFW